MQATQLRNLKLRSTAHYTDKQSASRSGSGIIGADRPKSVSSFFLSECVFTAKMATLLDYEREEIKEQFNIVS